MRYKCKKQKKSRVYRFVIARTEGGMKIMILTEDDDYDNGADYIVIIYNTNFTQHRFETYFIFLPFPAFLSNFEERERVDKEHVFNRLFPLSAARSCSAKYIILRKINSPKDT